MRSIERLLVAVSQGGEQAHEAALSLGLLLEDSPAERDGIVAADLGDELAVRRLSTSERDEAVSGLIAYVRNNPAPNAMTVWALVKSYDARAAEVLMDLLKRCFDQANAGDVAYQALVGVLNIGVATPEFRDRALALIRRASVCRHSEVSTTATQFLKVWNGKNHDEPKT